MRKLLPTIGKQTAKAFISAAAFIVLDIFFRRGFKRAGISFPSSLAGCASLFGTLLALPSKTAESTFLQLKPGAGLLAKWLPVSFVLRWLLCLWRKAWGILPSSGKLVLLPWEASLSHSCQFPGPWRLFDCPDPEVVTTIMVRSKVDSTEKGQCPRSDQ
jgi:hypothetical protein